MNVEFDGTLLEKDTRIILKGLEKKEYLRTISKSLEVLASEKKDFSTDMNQLRNILGFFAFDELYGAFETMKIDAESGLPLLTSIQDLSINQDKASKKLSKKEDAETLRKQIKNKCYNNNFDVSTLQKDLKIVDFFESIKKASILLDRTTEITSIEEKDNRTRKLGISVKGYDSAKMSWSYYDLELFHKDSGLGFISSLKGQTRVLQGLNISENFNDYFSKLFGHGTDVVYDNLREISGALPAVINRTFIKGFYFMGKDNDEFEPIFYNNPTATLLVLESNNLEDTDLLLSDELDADFLSKNYQADFLSETRRIYVCSEDIVERVNVFASHDKRTNHHKILTYKND